MNKMLLVLAVLLLLAPTAAPARPMDTGVILDLMGAGVSEVSIQRYVQRNHFTFDLSAQDLKALKKAGASDSLISFLQDRETGAPSGERNEATRPQDGSGDGEEQGGEYGSGTYGVSVVAPYYFGFSYGYPYYYADYYYPYYYPYYGYSYYGYPYYYGYHYPYYGSGHGGHGSGVVSYWHDGHSGRGGSRPPSSGSSPHPPQGSRQGGGHPQGSSRSGGGHGGRR